jgi:hypothetical protein
MLKDCWCFGISSCYKLISRIILHEHPLNRGASALYINYKIALNNSSYGDTFLNLYWLVHINYNQWSPNTQFVKSNFYVTDFPFVKVPAKSRTKHAIQSTDKIICTAYSEHVALLTELSQAHLPPPISSSVDVPRNNVHKNYSNTSFGALLNTASYINVHHSTNTRLKNITSTTSGNILEVNNVQSNYIAASTNDT